MIKTTCSMCEKPRDRDGQRYCRKCFNAYLVGWRKRRKEQRLHALAEKFSAASRETTP